MSWGLLYVSYTGVLEPLGQSQVLAYLERLAADRAIYLISFERPDDMSDSRAMDGVHARMRAADITWIPLRYHKRFSLLATLWDIAVGAWVGTRLVRTHGLKIVHARSYVPAAMALVIKRLTRARFVFDMRGFWADERVDGGLWPGDGCMYRVAKWCERKFLLNADHIVTLTHAAARELEKFEGLQGKLLPVTVIPTCADLDRFRPAHKLDDAPFTLGYVGSVGTWYLFDAAIDAFNIARRLRPGARFLILNRGSHSYVHERLQVARVPAECVELIDAPPSEVAGHMVRMTAGVFFIKPVFSKQASAPTKLAEFLGCGIPCLSNSGVGDMAGVLEGDRVGIAVDDFDSPALETGLKRLFRLEAEQEIATRCRASALNHFSLERGVGLYHAVYHALERTSAAA